MAVAAILLIATLGSYSAMRQFQEPLLQPSYAEPAEIGNNSYRQAAIDFVKSHSSKSNRTTTPEGIFLMCKILRIPTDDYDYVIWNLARIGGPGQADRDRRRNVQFGALVFATRPKDLEARDNAKTDEMFLTGSGKVGRMFSGRTVAHSFVWFPYGSQKDHNWIWMQWLVGSIHPPWPGKIVGYMLSELHPSWGWSTKYPHSWKLHFIETSTTHQGRGLARAMMAGVLDSLEQLDVPPIGLEGIEAMGQVASKTNAPVFWKAMLANLEKQGVVKTYKEILKFVQMHHIREDQMKKPRFVEVYTAWQNAPWQNAHWH